MTNIHKQPQSARSMRVASIALNYSFSDENNSFTVLIWHMAKPRKITTVTLPWVARASYVYHACQGSLMDFNSIY